jgi:hypothetical protein
MSVQEQETYDLVELIRQGIETTRPVIGRLHTSDRSRAGVLGAAKVALGDDKSWAYLQPAVAQKKIAAKRLPCIPNGADNLQRVLQEGDRPSLHLVLTTLNDLSPLSRTAILAWADAVLSTQERMVTLDLP